MKYPGPLFAPVAAANVAARFVAKSSTYWTVDGVDAWDESRDARSYPGPLPVVAHPPCSRWCRLAGLVEARWGHKKGDDGGCFKSALDSVRRWGGGLGHPAYSDAWAAFGIERPDKDGGWRKADNVGGWTAHVEQWRYGHAAKKATWLYAVGCVLPELKWGYKHDHKAGSLVSWCGNNVSSGEDRPRLGKKAAKATPIEFRDALLKMARSVDNKKETK